eukprot:jgi/Chrzof1/12442/Cz06g34240.t1
MCVLGATHNQLRWSPVPMLLTGLPCGAVLCCATQWVALGRAGLPAVAVQRSGLLCNAVVCCASQWSAMRPHVVPCAWQRFPVDRSGSLCDLSGLLCNAAVPYATAVVPYATSVVPCTSHVCPQCSLAGQLRWSPVPMLLTGSPCSAPVFSLCATQCVAVVSVDGGGTTEISLKTHANFLRKNTTENSGELGGNRPDLSVDVKTFGRS